MTYNRNFNNNFCGSNFTFRYVPDFPPPPLPPPVLPPMRPFFPPQPHYIHPIPPVSVEQDDQDFIKRLESQLPEEVKKYKPKATSISQIREEIHNLVTKLKEFEIRLNHLKENFEELPDDEWEKNLDELNKRREDIKVQLEKCVGSYMDTSRKLLAKRTAKRLRLKRLKEEKKLAKKERMKLSEERSRKIDENLQKIKDDILKVQKAEEAKLEADVVLREVRRQKQDAKKCLVKLDALLKLRRARQNTAKGRGENVSEQEATTFVNNVEKLKKLWNQKLLIYDKEESELIAKLAEDAGAADSIGDGSVGVEAGLAKWRELLFGDAEASPQTNFYGDVHRFIAVRSQWDQYLSEDGTALPVGWVVPPLDP